MKYYKLNLCGIKFPEHSNILCFYIILAMIIFYMCVALLFAMIFFLQKCRCYLCLDFLPNIVRFVILYVAVVLFSF